MNPVIAMCQAVMNNEDDKRGMTKVHSMADAVGIIVTEEVMKTLTGKPLLKYIL